MGILNTIKFIMNHPLNSNKKFSALTRYVRWQIGSRLVGGAVSMPFVDKTKLLIATGMHGATMSIYTGLQEFEDMAFVLHALTHEDLFIDVGANVGSYTVLAGGAVGARVIAIEPAPSAYACLQDNIKLNKLDRNVNAINIALGNESGVLDFTGGLDTINHVMSESESNNNIIQVQVSTLDDLLHRDNPTLIKIDVEGYEALVLSGGGAVLSRDSLLGVIMELNGSGARYGYSDSAIHEMMLDYGFEAFCYSPLLRQLYPLNNWNLKTGNTLYLRNVNMITERIRMAKKFQIHQSGASI